MKRIVFYLSDFKKRRVQEFSFEIQGELVKGFIVKKEDSFYAYKNECCHLPITLNLEKGDFFDKEGKNIQCAMHGAKYRIEDGHCFQGPCVGEKLIQYSVYLDKDRVVVLIPEE